MTTLLYHHNLRTFGGGELRMPQFTRRYAIASRALGRSPRIAGFTELSNANDATLTNLSGIARILNRNFVYNMLGPRYLVFNVGTTAVGNRREWIGIYWDQYAVPSVAGVILRNARNNGWGDPLMALPPDWPADRRLSLAVGQQTTLDSRGLAWIFTEVEGLPTIVAFMHNMYEIGEPSAAYDSLGAAIWKIQDALVQGGHSPGPRNAIPAILGGDFNIEPRALNENERTHRTGLTVSAEERGLAYVNTTQTHCYDYWFVTAGLPALTPGVRVEVRSRRRFVSDHAGISLRVG